MPAQKRKTVKKTVSRKQPKELKVASQNQRFVNYLLDFLSLCIFEFLAILVLVLFGSASVIHGVPHLILGALMMFIYYFPQEVIFGRTLGKLFTKTKVVNEDGSPLRFGRALGRTLCRFIPFDVFSYMASPIGWHDKISKTRVVPVE